MDSMALRKHMRDRHETMSSSTSPPLKRKRKMHEEKDVDSEPMDVEDIIVDDLSSSMEEMDIECVEAEEEEKTFKERSRLMDKKVKEKEKKSAEKRLLSEVSKEMFWRKKESRKYWS